MARAACLSLLLMSLVGPCVLCAQAPIVAVPEFRAADYILGPGDLLMVNIYGDYDLSREARISAEGYIWLPLLKEGIKAAGLTIEQLQNKISQQYVSQKLLTAPNPIISVKDYAGAPVILAGEWGAAGVVQVPHGATLLQIISRVNGLNTRAGPSIVITRRAMGDSGGSTAPSSASALALQAPATQTFVIPIKKLMEHPEDPNLNMELKAGDVVTAPRAEPIYVGGAVAGAKALSTNENTDWTVLQAVLAVGGLSRTAKPAKSVIIRKSSDGTLQEIPVDVKKVMARRAPDVPLQANDILLVPDSAGRHALNRALETLGGVVGQAVILTMARQ